MVRLCQSHRALLLTRAEYRLLRSRPARTRRIVGDECAEFLRDDREYARARHDVHADADVHLVVADHRHSHSARFSRVDGRPDLPLHGSLLRYALLPRDRRRNTDPVAASMLDLRSATGLLTQGFIRLSDDGLFDDPHRISLLRRMGPSYVRDRYGSGGRRDVLNNLDAHRDPDRGQDFLLALYDLGRTPAFHFGLSVRWRFRLAIYDRWTERRDARQSADRYGADRQLYHRRALPLRLGFGRALRDLRRYLLLLAEDYRPNAQRNPRQVALLA